VKKTVYIETSIPSYLTARPSRDVRASAWQEITCQWWEADRSIYELFTSELVVVEASGGDPSAASRRLGILAGIPELPIDEETQDLATQLMAQGGIAKSAEADALHVAVAAIHGMDFLLTWNCRHINNASFKPIIRSVCTSVGYACPEICTPLELLPEGSDNVQG